MSQAINVIQKNHTQTIGVAQVYGTETVKIDTEVEFLKGEDGYSPTVDVEIVDGGHNVTVTDVEGSKTFFVQDGNLVTDEQVQNAVQVYLTANPIKIDVVDAVVEGDMRPISSNAVHVEMGNINALLKTI